MTNESNSHPEIPTPAQMLGYAMGTARKLPTWHEMVDYYDTLAAASDRVVVERLGDTTDGLPYLAVFISSPENLARRDERRELLGRLWDQRGHAADTEAGSAAEQEAVDQGIVTAVLLCSQHSNEIGAALMTLELAAQLAAQNDPDTMEILDNVLTVIIPSHNPDGIQMITEWYRQWLDTPYEGQPMPWLYHRYVGHDNNRDWFMLTQKETRLFADFHNREHPQLVFDMHQMGRDGARFMVPPFIDPLDPNQDPVIQQGFADLGTAIATRLTAAGKSGVATSIIFDNYSPSLAYGNYHGSVDLLSEAASCNLASPVTVEEERFSTRDNFDPKVRSWNHPLPWKGGEWTLAEIVEYDRLAALAFLEHAARNRRQWLRNYAGIMRRVLERTPKGTPFAYLLPAPEQQRDPLAAHELLDTLALGAVEIDVADEEFTADGVRYPVGTRVIHLAQPAGRYAKTLLELQAYPDLRRWPDGPPLPPYDIAGHTLPLQMGVRCVEVREPFEASVQRDAVTPPAGTVTGLTATHGWSISPTTNASVRALTALLAADVEVWRVTASDSGSVRLAPGTLVIPAGADVDPAILTRIAAETHVTIEALSNPHTAQGFRVALPRIGVYQSWRPEIDEGWIRWIFDQYALPYTTLHDADVRQGNLRERFDTIVLPQQSAEHLLNGNPKENSWKEPYPPEYVGGLGPLGADALRAFVTAGGTLVANDAACQFAIEQLFLPVRNVVADLKNDQFYCPGSLLRVLFDHAEHPLAWGMQREEIALFMHSPALELVGPDAGTLVGRYPLANINASGWILGHTHIAGKGALAEVPLGHGRVVLIGFRAHHRAQARGTYRILFNAVLRSGEAATTIPIG